MSPGGPAGHARLRVLFVAGLTPASGGAAGGQVTAAVTLAQSAFAKHFDVMPLSSTMASIPPPPLGRRAVAASQRLRSFARMVGRADVALIFAADGLSVLEKGVMAAVARMRGKGVVLRLSSGGIVQQCERHRTFRFLLNQVLAQAHVVCAQGPFWTAFFESFPQAAGKVWIVPNGIVIPPRGDAAKIRPVRRVAMVTQVTRSKGVFEAIRAVERVAHGGRPLELIIAGGGADLEAARSLVGKDVHAARIVFRGWQTASQVDELLRASDVFLLPSHYEGLPNAMLEAMARGVPVVVTGVGAVPDVVCDGRSGLLVRVGDVDGIAQALTRLVDNPSLARAIGEEGRHVAEAHDIERVWRLYATAVERAAVEAGGRNQAAHRCAADPGFVGSRRL